MRFVGAPRGAPASELGGMNTTCQMGLHVVPLFIYRRCIQLQAGSSRASLYLFYDDVDDFLRYDDEFDYFLIADEFLDVR